MLCDNIMFKKHKQGVYMIFICDNDECENEFEDRTPLEIEEIDKDKYSTMYRATKNIICPKCDNEMEHIDEYWENDETGDIIR